MPKEARIRGNGSLGYSTATRRDVAVPPTTVPVAEWEQLPWGHRRWIQPFVRQLAVCLQLPFLWEVVQEEVVVETTPAGSFGGPPVLVSLVFEQAQEEGQPVAAHEVEAHRGCAEGVEEVAEE